MRSNVDDDECLMLLLMLLIQLMMLQLLLMMLLMLWLMQLMIRLIGATTNVKATADADGTSDAA